MNFNTLEKELFNAKNIFDFVSIIFYYLSEENIILLNGNYKKILSSKRHQSEFIKLEELLYDLFLFEDIDEYYFSDFKEKWIDLYKSNKINCDIFCLETLYLFDNNYLNYNVTLKNRLQIQGPLNNIFKDKVLFYNVSPKGCLSNYFENNNIRRGRQIVTHNPTNLDSNFKNFHIVSTNSLNSFEPKVIKYYKTINVDRTLIGIFPKKVFENIKINFDEERKLFDIEYVKKNYNSHLKYIFNTLLEMDNKGFKIAVFPELFLFPESLNSLTHFLLTNKFTNLELIFTGSEWNNNKNCSYILSSSGTVLNKHNKKVPYDYYCKSKNTSYVENIESDKEIEFLDIPGIGRISYLICRDFLNGELPNLCISLMESNVLFISAYTGKTNQMLESSKKYAMLNGVASVLCNSCSAVTNNDNLLGYIIVPKVENKKICYDDTLLFKDNIKCNECKHCLI